MKQSQSDKQQQNIIIHDPLLVKIIIDQHQIALLQIPRYLILLQILYQEGPLTLHDLSEKYAYIAKDDQAQSESTIYRYLSLLKKNNIIQEAGQQIIEGQVHSRILYSLSARYFIVDEYGIEWDEKTSQKVFKELVKILELLYPNQKIDEKALYQWYLRYQQSIKEDKKKLVESSNTEILEILSIWTSYSFSDIMAYLGWKSFLLKDPNAQNDFLNCFNEIQVNKSISDINSSLYTEKIEDKNYRDVFTQFPEFFYGLAADDNRRDYLEKPSYIPLFYSLRDGPVTIKELVNKYNDVAPIPKTRKTIYRYVKTLKDFNLVIEMGNRVTHGKKTTQRLFGPICRNITNLGEFDIEWKSKQRLWLIEALIKLLKFLHPEFRAIDKECFQKFRSSVSHYGDVKFAKEIKLPKNRKIFETIHSYNFKDFFSIIPTLWDYYFLLNITNLAGNLQKCFSK